MPANNSENNNFTESAITLQPFMVLFVGVVASLLILIPLLPIGIPNLTYSFTSINGHAPKIYWYLSRSAGFIGLSILWVSMALGLSITNKLARLWPGAPTAFAIHEYASLLGLVFVLYHGLVLMGDHFVDFSLPKLMLPFSIAYRTIWIGLGQVCFYIWLITAASFYVRPWIGQKTWRLIHYVNFATYTMGFLHGINSGTDSTTQWAHGYYLISGTSLLALLAYRIYDAVLKKMPIRELVTQRIQDLSRIQISITYKPNTPKVKNVPQALLREQARRRTVSNASLETSVPITTPAPAAQPINLASAQMINAGHDQTSTTNKTGLQTSEKPRLEPHTPVPVNAPILASAVSTSKPKAAAPNWMVKYENNSPENKINVRIFKEPTTRPIEELQKYIETKQVEANTLIRKLKKDFFAIPVQPTAPNRKSRHLATTED
ncbi:MAG: hypothetical protein ABI904_05520 [Chloroflexota bacterium]